MEPAKNFNHRDAEEKWYEHWLNKKYFNSYPDDREPYTITGREDCVERNPFGKPHLTFLIIIEDG